MKVDDVNTTLRREGRIVTEYIGPLKGYHPFISITQVFKIHGGVAIGINCVDEEKTPAISISVYGDDKEIKETKGLLKKVDLIDENW